jgi:hypothetical protein
MSQVTEDQEDSEWTCKYCNKKNTQNGSTTCFHCGRGNRRWHEKHLGSGDTDREWELDSADEVLDQMSQDPEYDPHNPDNSPFSIEDFDTDD